MDPARSKSSSIRIALDVLATVGILAACVVLVVANWPRLWRPQPKVPTEPLSLAGVPGLGAQDAPVVVIEYGDYECPFCGTAERQVVESIRKKYVDSGQVRLVYRQMPLESIHPFALDAARFAMCADQQGKFWETHQQLFANQRKLDKLSLSDYVGPLGLDNRALDACLGDAKLTASIRADAEHAAGLGITSTPTFLVGRRLSDGRVQVVARASGRLDQVEQAITTALAPEPEGSIRLIAGFAVVAVAILLIVAKRRSLARRARVAEA